jgi:hypothetical protein
VWPSYLTAQMVQQQQQLHMMQMQMSSGAMMPQMSALSATQPGTAGVYGEQLAMHMANAGRTGMGMAGLGLGIAGAVTGLPLDPFSAALGAGRGAFGAARLGGMGMMGSLGAGALGAAAGALPFYAAAQVAGAYGGAFFGGMNQQASLNSNLRSNFNFQGGGGAMGRGFSQQQMGSIGSMVSSELRSNPFTTSGEISSLISQGAESGMFNAVRDVQQFSQRFKTMLDGLKKIQKELGGTLSEAMAFTKGASQLGIFTQTGRTAFASEMRDTMSTTGMSQDQLFGLAAQGSMLSRATGGFGRQGAVGAMRTARSLGAAISSGAVNQELLSEATGGLTGTDAIQAFTGRMMQQTERFSRKAMGRFSIFALSNADGTGLDQGAVDRFASGDISTGSVMRDAHSRVNKMGRARALNREGGLRGALLEQGGLAAEIGMMRHMVGDRVLDQSDDMASLVLQRRFGMAKPEAELKLSMMRNQGSIAQNELMDRSMSKRQTSLQADITENRSLDAFMTHLQHGLQDAAGVTKVREMGRSFMTKISSIAERALNDIIGVSASTLSTKDHQAIQRLAMGMASTDDVDRLRFTKTGASGSSDPFAKPLANRALEALGLHGTRSVGEVMDARGVNLRNMTSRQRDDAIRSAELAQTGVVMGKDRDQMNALMKDPSFMSKLTSARLIASLGGDPGDIYGSFSGVSANAVDATMRRKGLSGTGLVPNGASLQLQGQDRLLGALGSIGAQGLQGMLLGGAAGAGVGAVAGGIGAIPGAIIGGIAGGLGFAGLEASRALTTDQDRALGFIARGGHLGGTARSIAGALKEGGILEGRAAATGGGLGIKEALGLSKVLGDGVDADALKGILNSEKFQRSIARLEGMKGDKRAMGAELEMLSAEANRMDPNTPEGKAALLAVRQMQFNVSRTGGIGKEFGISTEMQTRSDEARRLFNTMGSKYSQVSELLGDSAMGKRLSGIADQFYGGGDVGGIRDSVQQLQSQLAGMDPNSEEYRKVVEALGQTEETRGLVMGAAQQRNAVTQLTGKGRRGRAGQAESALGLISGGSLSELDFTMGKRTLNKRNQAQVLFQQFQKGGADADELEKQLASQLGGLGLTDAGKKVKEFRNLLGEGVTPEEATKLYTTLSSDKDLTRIKDQGVARMQQAQDPLGVQRNTLLEDIKTGINKLVEQRSDGVNMSTQPG